MTRSEEMNSLMDTVDSIQRRFLESLVTGKRDAIFGERMREPGSSVVNPKFAECVEALMLSGKR